MAESDKKTSQNSLVSEFKYNREFLFDCKCDQIVEIVTDLPFRRPRRVRRKPPPLLPVEPLETTENSWAANHASQDEYEELRKTVLGLLNKFTANKYSKWKDMKGLSKEDIAKYKKITEENIKRNDGICEKFIEEMNKHTLAEDQMKDFVSKIYLIVLKMYNNTFARLFKKYDNKEFTNLIKENIMKNFLISIGEQEDDRKISSLLEDINQIIKRYAMNNISFIIDMYNVKLIDSKQFKFFTEKLMINERLEFFCHLAEKFYKIHKNEMYDKTIDFLKTSSKDKTNNSRLRFRCMDVLDAIG